MNDARRFSVRSKNPEIGTNAEPLGCRLVGLHYDDLNAVMHSLCSLTQPRQCKSWSMDGNSGALAKFSSVAVFSYRVVRMGKAQDHTHVGWCLKNKFVFRSVLLAFQLMLIVTDSD